MAEKEKAILDARRILEDTERPISPSVSVDLAKLDAQAINLKLAVLYEAVASNGEVYAPMDGVVTRVLVSAGTRTADEAAVFIDNSETMNNETYAAVTGAISGADKIISASKRFIGNGDRVRLSIKE